MNDGPAGRRPGEPPEVTGTLAEEALRLIEAFGLLAGVSDDPAGPPSAGSAGGSAGAAADGAAGGEAAGWSGHLHGVGSAPECRVCPVCRLIVGVRRLRPEVVAHLVAAGEELLAAAREFAAPGAPEGAAGSPEESAGSPPPAGAPTDPDAAATDPDAAADGASGGGDGYRPPARPLQHIDLD